MSRLYLQQIGDRLQDQIREGLEFINWREIIFPDSIVFIKPNLTWPEIRPGVTTSKEFVEALLAVVCERTTHVHIGESNGGTFPAEAAFTAHGLPEICHRYNAELINLSKKPVVTVTDTIAGRSISIEASRFLIHDVDVFITLPVLKTHVVTRVSLGLKNQWGCIPSPMRLLYHHILDWGIAALNKAYRPQISILDGTYALDRHGPLKGDAIPTGWMALSDNVVALDAFGCHLLGVEASSVRHILFSAMAGMGTLDLDEIELNQPLPLSFIKSRIEPDIFDLISIYLYRSRLLSKLAFDSPFTKIIYKIINRTPPGMINTTLQQDAHTSSH